MFSFEHKYAFAQRVSNIWFVAIPYIENMSVIEFRHLRYAVTVADEGNMTRAATKLGIQQPPLSQQIRSLETLIGTPLFRRLPRGIELTEAGKTFVEKARAILRDVDLAVEATRSNARGEQGDLAIGFTSSSAFHGLVTSTVRSFGEASPAVALRLEEGSTPDLIQALLDRRLDVAFVRSPAEQSPELEITHIQDEEMLVALSDRHPLADEAGRAVRLSDLANENFILYRRPSGPGLYDTIISACLAAGFNPLVRHEATRLVSTLSLVAAGLGISIIPKSMARLETNGIAYLTIEAASPLVAPLLLARRRGKSDGALVRFIKIVDRHLAGNR